MIYQNKPGINNSPVDLKRMSLSNEYKLHYTPTVVEDVPEHFPELFELLVGHFSANGFQPLRHKTLPQWLTDDIVRYQAQDPVQALLQLGHRAT